MATTKEPWTVGRLLTWTADYLAKHGAENPRLDAEVLLAYARGCKRIDLYASHGDIAGDDIRAKFRALVKHRAEGTPVAYLIGRREFYTLDFDVTPDVLIPRPETELLVVALIEYAKKRGPENLVVAAGRKPSAAPIENSDDVSVQKHESLAPAIPPRPASGLPTLAIADVGTGSGIIAVCAAKYLPTARITAIDISPAALAVARRNAEKHGVADRIRFVEGNLLADQPATPHFDVIVSNPPYVATAEIDQLARDVREHEPHLALHGGETGTEIIAQLIEQATSRLKPGGALLMEISPMIAGAVDQIIRQQPSLELGPTMKDLAGHARVIQATQTTK